MVCTYGIADILGSLQGIFDGLYQPRARQDRDLSVREMQTEQMMISSDLQRYNSV
jgi:hypothetical protein